MLHSLIRPISMLNKDETLVVPFLTCMSKALAVLSCLKVLWHWKSKSYLHCLSTIVCFPISGASWTLTGSVQRIVILEYVYASIEPCARVIALEKFSPWNAMSSRANSVPHPLSFGKRVLIYIWNRKRCLVDQPLRSCLNLRLWYRAST